ncbi:SusC/RagA family TonB-linked outer membrane protein [Fulvitalea axinellae]|uniref:SusC/RagA family TonB-linked outer membrane protein n=1 Tax=Fulvitalea axinellae TaxID=1182444 RepID=A0AAU9CF47_9BACT|nr:SusC/RagA family TonB-linked outer membrane protein [Fulvitalea axinellae]
MKMLYFSKATSSTGGRWRWAFMLFFLLSAAQAFPKDLFTLSGKKQTLAKTFEKVETITSYKIAYRAGQIDASQLVSYDVKGASIEACMGQILKGTGLKYEIIGKSILISKKGPEAKKPEANIVQQEQKIRVTGTVKDSESGEGLFGVNIMEKGSTSNGTITDLSGKFLIIVDKNASIVVSSIGYDPMDVAVNGRSNIEVSLSPSVEQLDDVVVTAFGMKREKKKLGYAVTEVKGAELATGSEINPVSGLAGRVAGVQINENASGSFGGSRIIIRGNATLKNNNQPIYVVDGVIMDNGTSGGTDWGNDLKNLNPDDFESVSVLKGAAASALYGSRAVNGVILIITKTGKNRKGLGIDVSYTHNVEDVYGGMDFQDEFGAGIEYRTVEHEQDDYLGFPTNNEGEPYLNLGSHASFSYGPKMKGQKVRDYDGQWTTFDPQPDNYIDGYDQGSIKNLNVSLSGGNDLTTFRLSYSNTRRDGVLPNNDFTRNSFTLRATHQVTEKIHANAGLSYTISEALNPVREGNKSLGKNYWYRWPRSYNTNKWLELYKDEEGVRRQSESSYPGRDFWWRIYENNYTRDEDAFRGDFTVSYDILDWLQLQTTVNAYSYGFKETFEELGGGVNQAGGSFSLKHQRKNQLTVKSLLTATKSFGQDWDVSATLGAERFETKQSYTRAFTQGGLIVPGVYTLSNSKKDPKTQAVENGRKEIQSVYMFTNVAWKNMLFVDATVRNDWNSALTRPDGGGNNSFLYPSIAGSWVFSETFEMPAFVTFAKFRASYAEVGADPSPYSYLNVGFKKDGSYIDNSGKEYLNYKFSNNTIPNDNLQPERQKSIEFGVDLRFFKNRFGIDLAYYKNNTYDQILSLGVPSTTGVTGMVINAGDIENQGLELLVSATPIKTTNFSWDVSFNYTRNRNMINDLHDNVTEKRLDGGMDVESYAVVGEEYGILQTRYAFTRYQHMDGDTEIDHPSNGMKVIHPGGTYVRSNERTKVGNMMPDWFGGVTNTFRWKGLTLRTLIDMQFGADIANAEYNYGIERGILKSTLFGRDEAHGGIKWESADGETYVDGIIPSGVFPYGTKINNQDVSGVTWQQAYDEGLVEPLHAADYYWALGNWNSGIREHAILESSWVMLRELSLSYRFDRKFLDRIGLHSLDLSLFGRNLGYLYTSLPDGVNPNSNVRNKSGSAMSNGGAPLSRVYGFAVKLGI